MVTITAKDNAVLGNFPNAPANSWSDLLTEEDRAAYKRVHEALGQLATNIASQYPGELGAATTSGFSTTSGVRNQRPKDLWCALYNIGSDKFVRMPQIYVIASGQGLEMGFAAAIHRSDFSDQNVKNKLKRVIPSLFNIFPDVDDPVIIELGSKLTGFGSWTFKNKTRLVSQGNDFASLPDFWRNLKTIQGANRGSGSIAKFFSLSELEAPGFSLDREFDAAVTLFKPVMDYIRLRLQYAVPAVDINDLLIEAGEETDSYVSKEFDPENLEDGRKKTLRAIVERQGQGNFRASVLAAYSSKCVISGTHTLETLEAAHIVPYLGAETNHVTNGLLLRADLHTLFDLGKISIDADYKILVSADISDTGYRQYHQRQISLPVNARLHPSKAALLKRLNKTAEAGK